VKKELLERVAELPELEMTDIAIDDNGSWERQKELRAIREKGKKKAISVVSKYYKLVQFRDLYREALKNLPEEIEGRVIYWEGRGQMTVYPLESDVGIKVMNTADGKNALKIDFVHRVTGFHYKLPKAATRPFRKTHRGKIDVAVQDYFKVVNKVVELWKPIVEKLAQRKLDYEEYTAILQRIKAGERLKEKIEQRIAVDHQKKEIEDMTVWDCFQRIVSAITSRKYKSEIHKQKKLDLLAERILETVALDLLLPKTE